MATNNGPVQNNGQIQWDWTIPAVTQSMTSLTVTMGAFFHQVAPFYQNFNGSKSWEGAWGTGSGGQAFNLAAGQRVLLLAVDTAVTLTDSPQTLSYAMGTTHFFGNTVASVQVTVPARFARTPSGLSVTRVSDGSHKLDWTRNSTYTAVVVQRRTNGGPWVQVGRPTGNAATFTDTTTRANEKYEWRVAGVGGSGQSAWSAVAGPVFTTPAPVGAVVAEKVGADIRVTATDLPPYATAFEVHDNGALVDGAVTSWPFTHVAPDTGVTHTYTVNAKVGSLKSAGTVSNTVQLLAPPLAPSELSPDGGVAASDVPVRFEWRHNPVDTTAQTEYRLQYRLVGGSWTTVTGTVSSFRDVALPVGLYEWQVQTRGTHASFGPYSTVATATIVDRPGVAVQGDGSWDSPVYVASWTFTQAQSRPQSAWQVELLDADMERLEFREGSGAQTSVTLSTRMVDAGVYTVRVRAATGVVWSDWSPLEVTASFVPPADPLVEAVWQEQSGTVALSVVDGGGVVVADMLTVDRSIDGGSSWDSVVDSMPFDGVVAFADHEALSNGETSYRVMAAYSVTGAAAIVSYVVVADSDALWLSGGDGFQVHARLPYSPGVVHERGRSRAVKRYMGRSLGVPYSGGQVSRAVDVSGMLRDGDPDVVGVDALGDLACESAPVFMFRDPDGRRIYGVISNLSTPRKQAGYWSYDFQLEETTK